MLLSAGSRVSNTGLKWNPERTRVVDQGGSPSLIEAVTGAIVLRNLSGATAVSAVALDGAGKPIGAPISATKVADEWRLPIGNPVTTWYVVSVQRR
jgi:phage tail tape-measure protein